MIRIVYVIVYVAGFLLFFGCAGNRPQTPPANWVDNTLRSLTIEQKVGQMMGVMYQPRFYNENDPQFQQLLRRISDHHLGGITFFRGAPYAVARCIERLQEKADIPLLVMADMEWGVTMRVEEGTTFLQNMAIGATGSEEYAYEMGRITAEEARAIGIHVNYAPVMDVNNNPDNLIINTRSYGEDPALVARLGSAFIKGTQENGVYATMKHFPGHGDTDIDTHLGLPTIHASQDRLRNVELVPFQAGVDAGAKCVMVAHITYDAFPQMEGRPASLDPFFIQDILRKEMGFKGLVFTDAMNMGGITNNYWSGEAAVMAINAGVEMVLVPPNFETTVAFVIQAVKEGRIPQNTIDNAVRKILTYKSELGLYQKPVLDRKRLETVMASPQNGKKAEEIADAAITLLRDDNAVLPFQADKLDSVLLVTITDRNDGYLLQRSLRRAVGDRIPVIHTALVDSRFSEKDLHMLLKKVENARAVIAGVFVKWGSHKGSVSLADSTAELLSQFFKTEKPMAVAAFGSPYILRQIPEAPSYLCAYETSPLAVRAAMRAAFGEIPLSAKLPVSIPGFYEIGAGITKPAYPMTFQKNIQEDSLTEAYQLLTQAIADSIFPGAQIAILQNNQLIADRSFGRQTHDPASPAITSSTVYDLASVTKVVATTVAAMQLWEAGKLQLDIPVKSYLPKFRGELKDSVTLRNLLTHSGGLHWWTDLWNKAGSKTEALEYIYELPLDFAPGDSMIYSDLGLILAGQILEVVTGQPIDQLAHEQLFKPLGMNNTRYNPPPEWLPRIAPTEADSASDGRTMIHGKVHDENTFFLNGVSSHAGLFSTARDLAVFAQMLINGGIYGHRRYLSPITIEMWTALQNRPPGSNRALGWVTTVDSLSLAGDYFSENSFGHTGFTGTSFWIDPARDTAVILLTNRVYPTRHREGITEFRRAFHSAVMKALIPEHEQAEAVANPTDSSDSPNEY